METARGHGIGEWNVEVKVCRNQFLIKISSLQSSSLSYIYSFRSKVTHSDGSCRIKPTYTLIARLLPHHMGFENEFQRMIEAQYRCCLTLTTSDRERMKNRVLSKKVSVRRLMVNRLQIPSLVRIRCQTVEASISANGTTRRKE